MYAYIYSTNCFVSIQMEENHSHQGTVYADITNIGMDSVLKYTQPTPRSTHDINTRVNITLLLCKKHCKKPPWHN